MARPLFLAFILAWAVLLPVIVVLAHYMLVQPIGAAADVSEIGSNEPINLTMYHIHPLDFPSGNVSNRNLADLHGALYFDLVSIFQVFYCTDPKAPKLKTYKIRCNNTEYTFDGEKTAVSEVIVEVTPYRNKLYGKYRMCNPCQSGTSPVVPSHKCKEGEYICDCFKRTWWPPFWTQTECTDPTVGRGRIIGFGDEQEPKQLNNGDEEEEQYTKTLFVQGRTAKRTSGFWYSTLGIGQGVSWRTVRVAKKVTKACHAQSFVAAVAEFSRNRTEDDQGVSLKECIQNRCQQQQKHRSAASSSYLLPSLVTLCWAECLADATLGPNATSRDGYQYGGLDQSQLLAAWSRPFRSDDPEKGGCPDLGAPFLYDEPLAPARKARAEKTKIDGTELTLSELSYGMTKGTVIEWIKNVGDPVKKGEPLAVVESDTFMMIDGQKHTDSHDVEASQDGILAATYAGIKQTVEVGTVLGIIADN